MKISIYVRLYLLCIINIEFNQHNRFLTIPKYICNRRHTHIEPNIEIGGPKNKAEKKEIFGREEVKHP